VTSESRSGSRFIASNARRVLAAPLGQGASSRLKVCSGRVFACCRHPSPRCSYIIVPPPFRTFLPSLLNQSQAAGIDNPSISTATLHDHIG
jgi:hypothetical protein